MTVIALDVGGTSMKGAILSGDAVLETERRPTGRERGPAAVVGSILDFAADLKSRALHRGETPVAAGIALPGVVDDATGTAVRSANIGWENVPIRTLAAERLGIPVAIAHDVRTGGVGEAVQGAGRDVGDFLFLPIGTGIAAALMLNGAPYPGATSWSGEIGHIVVRPGGESCPCGARGCLETYASAAAISRRYSTPTRSSIGIWETEPPLPPEPPVPAEEVIERAETGDPIAARVWTEALDTLADALATATMLLDPSLIVIGGGLAEAGDRLFTPLTTRLADRLPLRPAPPLVPAQLGPEAAMRGAAVLAHQAIT
ncbi:ROK family protein [Actinomadura rudentiformis]|uniref:ROK family protein n=1 Tax=Actinomadura rudentiformis TaxID=359158 RepID=A0A6H9Z806_9ACTN|nr:ROK family protein [Actinomadura rudentiformis]KAB2351376.1 ROK family protein [Actinomadura rudentiformis]